MSCGSDIHFHTEVKIDGTWHTYGNPHLRRDYALFGVLAGVRLPELQRYPTKGFPEDAAAVTRVCYRTWGRDGHTHSYLTSDEIEDFYAWCEIERGLNVEHDHGGTNNTVGVGYLCGNSWQKQYGLPEGIEDVRWVFWFDH